MVNFWLFNDQLFILLKHKNDANPDGLTILGLNHF